MQTALLVTFIELCSYTVEVFLMGIKVQYVGARAYCEFSLNGVLTGFSRGMIRELPEDFVNSMLKPGIENGGTMWKILGDDSSKDKTDAMKATIEPTVEEIVESSVEDTVDYSSMSRAKLMALCKEKGIPVKNTSKKVELLELLNA